MSGSVLVHPPFFGAIAVDGHISGDVTLDQDASGDLVANADGIGGGDITGAVSMLNSFHGNICGDNLSPIEPLPANIDIFDFAADATICGALPGCGNGVFVDASPADGTHDARQPHPINDNSFGVRQGIGSPNSGGGGPEPITVTLTVGGANHVDCWSLCETGIEQVEVGTDPLSDNFVASVAETSSGVYEILLDRPISAGHWSTVTFFGDGCEVSYASLPADANADGLSASNDITAIINYINGVDTPPYGLYSTDINHSGVASSADITRLIDLLNGAGTFITWITKSLPTNTCATQSGAGGGGGGGGNEMVEPLPNPAPANAELSDAFVTFLTITDPSGVEAENDFLRAAQAISAFCAAHHSDAERVALADRLEDSNLTFASALAAAAAATAAETLCP